MTASVELINATPDIIAQEGAERRRALPRRKTWRPASELAVDLGTANTLVLVKGEGVVLNEPSVAAVDQATGNIMGIGLEAKRMLGRTPDGILAVRPMKDGVIANFEVAEKMLRHFLRLVIDRTILKVKPQRDRLRSLRDHGGGASGRADSARPRASSGS